MRSDLIFCYGRRKLTDSNIAIRAAFACQSGAPAAAGLGAEGDPARVSEGVDLGAQEIIVRVVIEIRNFTNYLILKVSLAYSPERLGLWYSHRH